MKLALWCWSRIQSNSDPRSTRQQLADWLYKKIVPDRAFTRMDDTRELRLGPFKPGSRKG